MRFLNILNSAMLEKRLKRIADRNALSALIGAIRFTLENSEVPEEKRKNLQGIADFGDAVIEDNTDLEATCVALYDCSTQHAEEVKVLRLENARLKLEITSLKEQLKLSE